MNNRYDMVVCVLEKSGCCIDMLECLEQSDCRCVATQIQSLDVLR